MRAVRVAPILLLLWCAGGQTPATDDSGAQRNDFGYQPLGRSGASVVAVDSNTFLMYGGLGTDGAALNDVWEYKAASDLWTQMHDGVGELGQVPEARVGHGAVFLNGKLLVHAGYNDITGELADLWSYHREDGVWTQLTFTEGPDQRSGHSMVASGTNTFLVFGGSLKNDLWEYSVATSEWRELRAELRENSAPAEGGVVALACAAAVALALAKDPAP
mmetsp:Transcript_9295/g.30689  ORF Transcript_9295/g.30689 Transcript_9295/m.30689 type:complete len:218 (+) Transcript_9295:8-661(+)